jgi:hypothetical protein
MGVKQEFAEAQRRFGLLGFYDKFEHIVILILTALIAIWNLAVFIVFRTQDFFEYRFKHV